MFLLQKKMVAVGKNIILIILISLSHDIPMPIKLLHQIVTIRELPISQARINIGRCPKSLIRVSATTFDPAIDYISIAYW